MSVAIWIKNAHIDFGSLVDTLSYDTPYGHKVRYMTNPKGKQVIQKIVMKLLKERQNVK
ncbi:MAG: hypothetical protein MJ158_00875 [Alphaproteobacteria bacterium]|nr:hypothetical protein [Alphaproteobacteria bacterium]